MNSSQPLDKRSKDMPKNIHYLSFNLLKMPEFYIGSTIRPLHIGIKEHLHTPEPSLQKRFITCKNDDNKFSIKIETIVRIVGNLRFKDIFINS